MPAPATCIVSGTLYDGATNPLPNTVIVISVPAQVIGGATVAASIVSTITDSAGAMAPIALPQTAIVAVTIGSGITILGIVPGAVTGSISALLSGTVFGGALTGANFQVNGVNLQSQLLVNFVGGRDITFTNPSGGNIRPDLVPLIHDVSEIVVASSVTETNLFSDDVLGGTLGTTGVIRGWADVLVGTILTGSQCTFRLKFGGTVFLSPVLINSTGSTQGNFPLHFEFNIRARNSAAAQNAFGHAFLQQVNPTSLYLNASGLLYHSERANVAADSTISQSIQLSAQWSVNSSSNSLQGDGLYAY